MEFQDKVLKCIDCGADFIFTAGEQLFFHDKQFKNEPKRCKACKTKRVSVLGAAPSGPGNGFAKVETRTTCSECGKETKLTFLLLPDSKSNLVCPWRSPRGACAVPRPSVKTSKRHPALVLR